MNSLIHTSHIVNHGGHGSITRRDCALWCIMEASLAHNCMMQLLPLPYESLTMSTAYFSKHRIDLGMSGTCTAPSYVNSDVSQIMHYSRIMPPVGGHRYYTSTAVFLGETVKLAVSLTMALSEVSRHVSPGAPATTLFANLLSAVFTGDSWKMAVPAVLYTLQNSLQYVAVSNLDPSLYMVTYQLKILSSAIFSVTILRRQLGATKWLSLILLMIGVAVVQIPSSSEAALPTWQDLKDGHSGWRMPRTVEQMRDMGNVAAAQLLNKRSATYQGIDGDDALQHPQMNPTIGLVTAICACLVSGLAGVYCEKILKDSSSTVSLWVRNVQLSFYSLFPALFIGVMFRDGADISKNGFFAGYDWIVWLVILIQAFGGLVVSAVFSFADNITKNFATSISIILSFLISMFVFDLETSFTVRSRCASRYDVALTMVQFVLGSAAVLLATYIYNGSSNESPLPGINISVHDNEKYDRDHNSYFDIDPVPPLDAMTMSPPLRGDVLTTSRPSTPTFERRHLRSRSSHENTKIG